MIASNLSPGKKKLTELKQAVVVITGATGGFGVEFAKQLYQAGSRLILSDLSQELLSNTAASVEQSVESNSQKNSNKCGEILGCVAADLSDRQGREHLYQQFKALAIPIDILINNAGIGIFGRMDEVPVEHWEKLMQVNLIAPMALSALFVTDMIAQKKGHIVNISSLAGWFSSAGMAHYSASKFGLRGFSEGLANEVREYNVKVTAVYPFFSRTPILNSPRYGTLAEQTNDFADKSVSNPADVVRVTIKAIKSDRAAVFPDPVAKQVYVLKRLFPRLFDWLVSKMN